MYRVMILSYRHKALKALMEEDKTKGLVPHHVKRIKARLDRLDATENLEDLPAAWRPHALHGELEGFYAIDISAQWRIIFRFEDGDAFDVDYVQYH
jgi:proteic killer suppression protein